MHWNSFAAAVAVCALGACLVAQSARTQPARQTPRLVLNQTERDLGAVAAGTLLRGEFSLGNAGRRRLIVREDACSACGAGEWMIEPGGRLRLTIEFDTAGLQGRVRHVRHYTTSDPLQPRLALILRATVGPAVAQ